jgi:hypothetical protein
MIYRLLPTLVATGILVALSCNPGSPEPVSNTDAELAPTSADGEIQNLPKGGTPGQLFPVRVEGKAGYIDHLGEIVIKPQFEGAWDFYGDRGVVWRHFEHPIPSEFAVIDKTGALVSPWYESGAYIHTFSEGYLPHGQESKMGYVSLTDGVIVEPQFHFPPFEETGADCYCVFEGGPVAGFSEGLALVQRGHGQYFIDADGNDVFGRKFDQAYSFKDGFAPVMIDEKWGLINHEGEVVIEPTYAWVGEFSDGLWPVKIEDSGYGHWVFVDSSGQPAFPAKYEFAYSFSGGLAAVKLEASESYSYIDPLGDVVFKLPPRAEPGQFSEGLVKIGLSDEQVVWTGSSKATFSNGQIAFFDQTGNKVIELDPMIWNPTGDGVKQWGHFAADFSNGLAKVWSQDPGRQEGYIDRQGNWIWISQQLAR